MCGLIPLLATLVENQRSGCRHPVANQVGEDAKGVTSAKGWARSPVEDLSVRKQPQSLEPKCVRDEWAIQYDAIRRPIS